MGSKKSDNAEPKSEIGVIDVQPATLSTVPAAKYLGVSPTMLRHWRMKRRADPGERGPPWIEITPRKIVYSIQDMNAWLQQRKRQTPRHESATV